MASAVLKYKLWCSTDSKWEYVYLPDTDAVPTICPTNTGHAVDTNLTSQTTYVASSDVEIANTPNMIPIGGNDPKNAPAFSPGARSKMPQFLDCSHNWADKTTWHTNAAQKTGQTLTLHTAAVPGTHGGIYRFDDPNNIGNPVPFWIDANHFKLYHEATRHSAKVVKVYDNAVAKVVAGFGQTHATSGVNCEVDYAAGLVTFEDGYSPVGVITADFFHVDNTLSAAMQSEYTLHPPIGHVVVLERVEVQFTKDLEINDSCHFAGFVWLNYIASQTDATLDPTAYGALADGMAFLIEDAANLHANFGTIEGVGNNDIVIYREDREYPNADGFVVWFDASEESSGAAMNAILGASPAPTIRTWNGTVWSAEGYGAPVKAEIPETRDTYDTFADYLNDATGNYCVIPAGFSAGARGCAHEILQIPFNWLGSKHLNETLGLEMRVWLDAGVEFGPDRTHFATATFYGQIHGV